MHFSKKNQLFPFRYAYFVFSILMFMLVFLPINMIGQKTPESLIISQHRNLSSATISSFPKSQSNGSDKSLIQHSDMGFKLPLEKIVMILSLLFLGFIGVSIVYVKHIVHHHKLEKQAIQYQQIQKVKEVHAALDQKNKELTALSLKLIEKEEKLSNIKKKVQSTNEKLNSQELNQIVKSISTNHALNWNEFETQFLKLNDDFYKKLTSNFPKLTRRDIRLCALIKLNFSGKEMAQLSGVSLESIHTSRYRLRKKLNLSKKENLNEFILSI